LLKGVEGKAFFITSALHRRRGPDKLLPFMQKLKTLGYVKERTPKPMSDKDRVMIRIKVSKP